MTLHEPLPLTPEEQALARRLGRLGPRGEPSPALDARVLAAAHAEAQAPRERPLASRRRWPAVAGLAASLVLAAGLAWRLQPQQEPPPAPRAGAVATPGVIAHPIQTPPGSASGIAPGEPTTSREAASAARAPTLQVKPFAAKATSPRASAVEPPAEPAARAASDAVMPMAAPAPSPPPPPPEVLRDRGARTVVVPASPAPAAAASAEAASDEADTGANEADAANAFSGIHPRDEPADEVPPATVDSPAVRDAWLQRIHGLVEAGDIAGARASLREFARRYPDYPLPEDLRALGR